jgi:hypothetical protein
MGIVSTTRLLVVVGSVSAAAACGGRGNDREPSPPAGDPAAAQQIAVTGCVESAPGNRQYVLRDVRMAPTEQHPADTPSASGGIITEGSWVKLRIDERAGPIDEHAGRMVTVFGRITDTGRNAIGTSGPAAGPADPQSRKDADGKAPEITVERVEATGKPCDRR